MSRMAKPQDPSQPLGMEPESLRDERGPAQDLLTRFESAGMSAVNPLSA
jgi:hypothetical protein